MKTFKNILMDIPSKLCKKIEDYSHAQSKYISNIQWWHNKYYKFNYPNNGSQKQKIIGIKLAKKETPHVRHLFYPANKKRFSLGSRDKVAYFSENFITSFIETSEKYREISSFKWKDPWNDLSNTPRNEMYKYGYPICRHIKKNAKILDLKDNNNPLFSWLKDNGIDGFYESVLLNRDETDFSKTQDISFFAKQHGYQAILYLSVRAQACIDFNFPDLNLVLFEDITIQNHITSQSSGSK